MRINLFLVSGFSVNDPGSKVRLIPLSLGDPMQIVSSSSDYLTLSFLTEPLIHYGASRWAHYASRLCKIQLHVQMSQSHLHCGNALELSAEVSVSHGPIVAAFSSSESQHQMSGEKKEDSNMTHKILLLYSLHVKSHESKPC